MTALAACAYATAFAELGADVQNGLGAYLDSAVAGGVSDDEFVARITQGMREATDDAPARDRLAR